MNKRVGTIINSKKAPLYPQNGKKMEFQGGKSQSANKTTTNRRRSAKERKLALLQDVDDLKKKLKYEENVHRALERAFNRPLGSLPRLPPYLPQYTLELVAEVAVLEEEVVRLEEQVVNCRQGLYKEAIYISSKRSADYLNPSRNETLIKSSKQRHSRSLSQNDQANLGSFVTWASPSLYRSTSSRRFMSSEICLTNGKTNPRLAPGKENQSSPSLDLDKEKKSLEIGNVVKRSPLKPEPLVKSADTRKIEKLHIPPQTHHVLKITYNFLDVDYRHLILKEQCRNIEQVQSSSSDDRVPEMDSEANKMSEDILKCLINIFVRLGSSKGQKTMDLDTFSFKSAKTLNKNYIESDFWDPYCNSSEFKKRDIGNYKYLHATEACSIDLKQKKNASFLIRRLKLLLAKLASVKLESLCHQQKLAFWINIYNSCIMNSFLENGIPENPDMILFQMQKATIKVGGQIVNALMIEHLILRLPYHLQYTCPNSAKTEESKVCTTFGLEWSEPLVTFALSCGSWSSPAVRVYTASQIETELEIAKKDYLQAAVGISTTNKIIIPKLLDWYLLDFAKDMDAFLDWLCLQLPDELMNEAVKCLERKGNESLLELVCMVPYDFSFRYLICQ